MFCKLRVPFQLLPGILLFLLIASCTRVFFDRPQPLDSVNLKSVPKELQGRWIHAGSADTIVIDGSSFHLYSTVDHIYPDGITDTAGMFRYKDERVYTLEDNFSTGYLYRRVNDTLFFSEHKQTAFGLSDTSFLRGAGNTFVYNLSCGKWWELYFIRKNSNGEIEIFYPQYEELKKTDQLPGITRIDASGYHTDDFKSDTVFFHALLSSAAIVKIFNETNTFQLYILRPDSTYSAIGDNK